MLGPLLAAPAALSAEHACDTSEPAALWGHRTHPQRGLGGGGCAVSAILTPVFLSQGYVEAKMFWVMFMSIDILVIWMFCLNYLKQNQEMALSTYSVP